MKIPEDARKWETEDMKLYVDFKSEGSRTVIYRRVKDEKVRY